MDPANERNIERHVEELGTWESLLESADRDPLWKELDGIARMMQESPSPEPSEGLGDRVMSKVRDYRPPLWRVCGEALLRPHEVSFHPLKALRSPVSGQECSFYFILVGVFYAVLGAVLLIGLHSLGEVVAPGWVRWQPQIALVIAGCMVSIGLYLLKDGKLALRAARIGVLVYLGFSLLNALIVPFEKDIPVSAVLSTLSTLIGLPTGFFLARAVQNCGKRYA